MEIDKSIADSRNETLKSKYNSAVFVIRRALALYSIEELAFSFNGGKDSTVLLHLLRASYFLHMSEDSLSNCALKSFPIRTIYFARASAFPEINSFTYDTASSYDLKLDVTTSDFKSGLETMLKDNPIRAIFLGVRFGDPTAVDQEQFSPSSPGWPPFMRVNPILDWSYSDVWEFILTCKVHYCNLYDKGYTSIGSIHDTIPNSLLSVVDSSTDKEQYKPAYLLSDGRLERAGRIKKNSALSSDGMCNNGSFFASTIAVGDEILLGTVEDKLGHFLRKKLFSFGVSVSESIILGSDSDMLPKEVDRQRSSNDMVFIYGDHNSALAAVAKAFGVQLSYGEEYQQSSSILKNKLCMMPDEITELIHCKGMPMRMIKCRNVIVLTSTNVRDLEKEFNCFAEIVLNQDEAKKIDLNIASIKNHCGRFDSLTKRRQQP